MHKALYLSINQTGLSASDEGLDFDSGLSDGQIKLSHSQHAVCFLYD